MIIGVPKEIKEQEYRVALAAQRARISSSSAAIRSSSSAAAGIGAGYPDAEYQAAGATLS
jgi:alanine dehydrogenase